MFKTITKTRKVTKRVADGAPIVTQSTHNGRECSISTQFYKQQITDESYTEQVEVGPGYMPIFKSQLTNGWCRNAFGSQTSVLYPTAAAVDPRLVTSVGASSPPIAIVFVPEDATPQSVLDAYNALKPTAIAEPAKKVSKWPDAHCFMPYGAW